MTRTCCALATAALTLTLGGCLASDQLTTLTINPDGSADLVIFRSNIRSTEKGERGEQELAEYQARFSAQEEQDFQAIREAGGEILESSWIRARAPLANVLHARLANAAALEKYGTHSEGDLRTVMRFVSEGPRRRLTVRITSTLDPQQLSPPATDAAQLRQQLADGISEIRIVTAGGAITEARGFTVASDKQSALLDAGEILKTLRSQSEAEFSLEWEVAP